MGADMLEQMNILCRTPLGKGRLVLIAFSRRRNVYGSPAIPTRHCLAYEIDQNSFILFDSTCDLIQSLSDDNIPQAIKSDPKGFASLLAAYFELGRVVHGKECLVAKYAAIDLEGNYPRVMGEELVFVTIQFDDAIPKTFRHAITLESLDCRSTLVVASKDCSR